MKENDRWWGKDLLNGQILKVHDLYFRTLST
ncbi:hypothetical protein [Bacillus thuringiensis]|nr:hypothetical protein [Bacillus thuringiensis]